MQTRKFKWKSKKFIGGLLGLIVLGSGAAIVPGTVPLITEIVCQIVECE